MRRDSSGTIRRMADDEPLARAERAYERNTAAFDRNTDAFDRNLAAFDRNTAAFDRNSAVVDAALERLHRSEDEHREFMREMMLRFEKLDERMNRRWDDLRRDWSETRRELAEERRIHDQAILSILDRLERLGPGGATGHAS